MRPIRLLQTSAEGFFLTDAAAVFAGAQLDERSVVDRTDTVIDPEVCKHGAWIDLPIPCPDYAGRTISKLWYPAFENQKQGRVITLNRMAMAGNRLLRIIQSYNEGLIPVEFIQRGAISYQRQAILQLGGKNGVVNANIVAGRVKRSGRGVIVVNATHSPEWVSLPTEMMALLGLEPGELVIVGREPTVWGGSIEVLRARHARSNCIEVHPLLFKQWGADCVGNVPVVLRHKMDFHHQLKYNPGMATTTLIETKTHVADLRELAPETGIFKHDDLQVLDHEGRWVDLKWAQRKLPKSTIDIVTRHGGLLRITPDHRVKSDGIWKTAGSLKIGDRIDLQKYRSPSAEPGTGTISQELAWVLGLICADGTLGSYVRKNSYRKKIAGKWQSVGGKPKGAVLKNGDTRYEFRLSNNNVGLLKKAKQILEDEFGISMKIQKYYSERPGCETRFPTTKHISHLVVSGNDRGQKKEFVLTLMQLCCGHKNQKKIPTEVFGATDLSEAWLEGFNAGDGRRDPGNANYDLAIGDREILAGIGLLAHRLGMTITVTPYRGRNAFNVRVRKHRSQKYLSHFKRPDEILKPDEIVAIEQGPVVPVFDLKTEGEFVAGLFQVHNCDGDTVWVYAVPKNRDCQVEAEAQILGFTKTFAKWPSYLRLNDPSEFVYWDDMEDVQNESRSRCVITGFSVSPEEIVNQDGPSGERLKKLCETTGKDVSKECLEIANGVDTKTYQKYVEDQNHALITMKLGMGPIGSAANKLRLIAGIDQRLLESASYLSERLQQILLDTKHTVGRKETYSIEEILSMLNKAEQYRNMTLYDALEELSKVGIDKETVWPIMSYVWIVWPLTRAVRAVYEGIQESRMKRIEFYARDFMDTRDIGMSMRRILATGKIFKDVEDKELVAAFYEYSMGIGKICEIEFPMALLANNRIMKDPAASIEIAKRIFALHDRDSAGVTRLALEEAMNVQRR